MKRTYRDPRYIRFSLKSAWIAEVEGYNRGNCELLTCRLVVLNVTRRIDSRESKDRPRVIFLGSQQPWRVISANRLDVLRANTETEHPKYTNMRCTKRAFLFPDCVENKREHKYGDSFHFSGGQVISMTVQTERYFMNVRQYRLTHLLNTS